MQLEKALKENLNQENPEEANQEEEENAQSQEEEQENIGPSSIPGMSTNGMDTHLSLLDLHLRQQQRPSHIPSQDDEYKVVLKGGREYQAFIRKLEYNNTEAKMKNSACLLCWGFITYHQKRRHQEHAHYTVTPTHFGKESKFLDLAQKHGKLHTTEDDKTLVAIFADQCKIIESSYINAPARSTQFAQQQTIANQKNFGNQTVNEIRTVSQKQIEQEQQIKRLNTIITTLIEEVQSKKRRIQDLEQEITKIQQLVCSANQLPTQNIRPSQQQPAPQQSSVIKQVIGPLCWKSENKLAKRTNKGGPLIMKKLDFPASVDKEEQEIPEEGVTEQRSTRLSKKKEEQRQSSKKEESQEDLHDQEEESNIQIIGTE
ncbi:hypothetical protein FGO68_gene4525 [Halteria grandinella]|uniref:Uncharacterized protein n=1 Tax=Halteria grandinella TaxID=5974 RepID=A0A8J8T0J2_HALGN|nr:hypothetical protein FGO68_gene4525 [Halteria grandinella]